MLRVVAGTGLGLVAVGVFAMIAVQFAHIVQHNLVLARELSTVRSDVHSLERKRADQQRTIHRLHDPEGAVPEIHDRLHLVRPGEVIIYVKSASERTPAP
jgi:cell division protein FtsB